MGHQTEVVSLDQAGVTAAEGAGYRLHPLGYPGARYGYTPHLARWVKQNASRFDVAVIHGLWRHVSVGGWLALRRAGLPYVVYTHGMMDPWFKRHYPLKHWLKQIFWTLWQGKVLRDAEAVLFTCEEERALAKDVFWGHRYTERVVAYGASDTAPPGARFEMEFRRLVPALGSRRFLLFMSRIHPKKGCDLLVEAFATIAADFPDIDLVIAGPDQVGLRGKLELAARAGGIADRIHWPGMISGSAKAGALQLCEAMILPSHSENFGIVVAEALAYARPVLISNRVNIWREVANAGAGLVADDTKAGTISLMRAFLSMPESDRKRMGSAGRDLYLSKFTPLAAAQDLERVLLTLRAEGKRNTARESNAG
jgi:glycosyltransferase involved in cell wall biosynthesis